MKNIPALALVLLLIPFTEIQAQSSPDSPEALEWVLADAITLSARRPGFDETQAKRLWQKQIELNALKSHADQYPQSSVVVAWDDIPQPIFEEVDGRRSYTFSAADVAVAFLKTETDPDRTPIPPLQMQVFPNPSSGPVSLGLSLSDDLQETALTVTDLTGRIVLTQEQGGLPAGARRLDLDLSDLSEGSYLVSFSMDGRVLATEQLIISR